ncbi:MAG: FAD:protein FMN transferase [Deltaproteobacteria bacterium]|nr:FAD:protein FMN transferase [Deltaproteobacteria bacterium]
MLFRYPFVVMGSGCEMLIEGEHQAAVKAMVQSTLEMLHRLERTYSRFQENSLLSRIHREGYRDVIPLDAEARNLFEMAGALYRETSGRFDPTVGTLSELWDFRQGQVPEERALRERLEAVGWERRVTVTEQGVRLLHPQTRLDFGGLVKEYALDCAVGVLRGLGVRRGLVNLGGDLRLVRDLGPDERPFTIGIAHPRRHHDTVASLALRAGAVVTSGDYQRYFMRDGMRYHHVLDPRTGRPMVLQATGVTAHGSSAVSALRLGKRLLLGPEMEAPEAEASAFLVCGTQGQPLRWMETPECRILRLGGGEEAPGLERAGVVPDASPMS